ncbi:NCA2-domain-containing protein, partial [Mycena alexandri]
MICAMPSMSRLRVDSSRFADNFTRPLSLTRLPTPEPGVAASASPVVTEFTGTLRSLLVSLNPPVSQSSVDEALKFLAQGDRDALFIAEDVQETALKSAVVNQVAVGLYARGLDIYLNEATEIEAEADWWASVECSSVSLAWFFLQTLPFRLARVLRTILEAFREQHLPLRLSLFTPSSLFRIFPATALRPSALTSSFFPHLEHEQTLSSLVWVRRPSQFIHSIWSAIFLPLNLTREECRYKRRKLETIRDERAEQLGELAQLRLGMGTGNSFPSKLVACISGAPAVAQDNAEQVQHIASIHLPSHIAEHGKTIQQLRRPSRFILLWPKILLLPPLAFFTVKTMYASRASITEMTLEAKETVEGFIKNSLVDPLKEVLKTVRTGGENGVIVRPEGVAADLESLERMTLSLARDSLHYDAAQLAALSQKIKVGDLTPVLQLYEEDIKKPVKSALTGTLLRSMFIQVQKAKVDIDQALAGIDKLLKSQELTFAFVGLAPALVIVTLLGSYASQLFRGGRGEGRFGGRDRRTGAWLAMRRIERLLVSQPRLTSLRDDEASHSLSPLTTGLLLISVTRLRTFAESSLPRGSRLREGFLEDVGDLEDPAMPREEKLRVVDRMWRSWGGALGWHHIAAQGSFSWRKVLSRP